MSNEMLKAFAMDIARRTVERVQASGLESGYYSETANVQGTEWHVACHYQVEGDSLVVRGHTHDDQPSMGWMPFGPPQDTDHSFEYRLPASWLLPPHLTAEAVESGEVHSHSIYYMRLKGRLEGQYLAACSCGWTGANWAERSTAANHADEHEALLLGSGKHVANGRGTKTVEVGA